MPPVRRRRRLHSCIFSGTLPAAWGSNASMPGVRVLSLQGNKLEGRLPDEWGEVGTMGHLEELYLQVGASLYLGPRPGAHHACSCWRACACMP